MSDPTATLLTICRRLVDPGARPIALHSGHNGTAVLRAATSAGHVIVKCHRGRDRHHQEIHAYQHWTLALGAKAPRLIAISEEPPGIVVTALPGQPLAEAELNIQHEVDAHRQAGEILRVLHNAAAPSNEPHMTAWLAERGECWLTLAKDLLNAQRRTEIRAHLRDLAALGPLPAVPCHLDFTPRNLMCTMIEEGRNVLGHQIEATAPSPIVTVAAIDFEHARFDLAARDLVRFATRVWPNRPDLEAAFVGGYGDLTDLDRQVIEHCSHLDALTGVVRRSHRSAGAGRF
jgi:Ser/Thr protein kinase RdoA (MazF antagonist)